MPTQRPLALHRAFQGDVAETKAIQYVEFIDIMGNVKLFKTVNGLGCTINDLHLGKGIYFVKTTTTKGIVTTKKLVIQ